MRTVGRTGMSVNAGLAGLAAMALVVALVSACGGGGSRSSVVLPPGGPVVLITKTALPTSVPETGGSVQFTIVVTNAGLESFTIDSLTDTIFNLSTTPCSTAATTVLAPTQSYQCVFNQTLSGTPGTPHVDSATVTVSNGSGDTSTVSDNATVSFLSLTPDITVTKTALPTSVLETGGNVQFTITVTSHGADDVTIDSLSDTVFNLAANSCSTAVGTVLQTNQTYTCSFTQFLSGSAAGPPHQNTVTAQASAGTGTDSASASATVTYTDVLVAAFHPSNSSPGANTISMQPGTVSSLDFDVEIRVTSIASFFGAAFHVQFNPATATFTGFDATGSVLGSGPGTLFFANPVSGNPGEIAVEASLQGTGAGLPSASGLLLTLHFQATGSTAGNAFGFLPTSSRSAKSCPTAGGTCNEIAGGLTWSGGSLVVN